MWERFARALPATLKVGRQALQPGPAGANRRQSDNAILPWAARGLLDAPSRAGP